MAAATGRDCTLRLGTGVDSSGDVEVSVQDSGTGLDPEDRDRIFEPFFTTKSHGMGMGLMICRSIIEAHGGRLQMTGNGDEGAIFQFVLPAATESVEELPK
jgi:signal transduction histidine kinase